MHGHEYERVTDSTTQTGQSAAHPSAASAGLRAFSETLGNQALAAALRARRAPSAGVARQPGPGDGPPPLSPQVRAVAEKQIAPQLRAASAELRAEPPPTLEHLRRLRMRVATARGHFDTVPSPASPPAADNWFDSLAATAISRTLLDGLLFPGSDAELRLAWGKALGTCRQLVGLLRQAAASAPAAPAFEPAPSPNPLPPPLPPPPGSEPAPALPPDQAMEIEVCPRIEAAIAEIPHMLAAETTEEITAVKDRFADLPEQISTVAGGEQFGPVAALEFQKGLELVNQATLTPPEQLLNIAENLDLAATLAENLEAPRDGSAAPVPVSGPAPAPNPLPPPPPPPLTH